MSNMIKDTDCVLCGTNILLKDFIQDDKGNYHTHEYQMCSSCSPKRIYTNSEMESLIDEESNKGNHLRVMFL